MLKDSNPHEHQNHFSGFVAHQDMEIEWRKVARKLCLRKRDTALSTQDQFKSRKLKKLNFLCILKFKKPGADLEVAGKVAHMAMDRYYSLNLQLKRELGPTPAKRTSIRIFLNNDCWNCFGTRRQTSIEW